MASELKVDTNIGHEEDGQPSSKEREFDHEVSKESKCLYATTVVILFLITLFQKCALDHTSHSVNQGNVTNQEVLLNLDTVSANWVNFKMGLFSKQLPIHVVFFICSYIWPAWGVKVHSVLNKLLTKVGLNYYNLIIVCNACVALMTVATMTMMTTMVVGHVNMVVILCELFNSLLFSHVLYYRCFWPLYSYPWWWGRAAPKAPGLDDDSDGDNDDAKKNA
jgi:hypothetical protein